MTAAQRRERVQMVMVIVTLITGERVMRYRGPALEYVDPDSSVFGFALTYFDTFREALQGYLDVVEVTTDRYDRTLIVIRDGAQL